MPRAEVDEFLMEPIVVEEKLDGANLGLSFDSDGRLWAQNRGNFLEGRLRGQWENLRGWLARHERGLREHLPAGAVLFGEWCFARHSVSYTRLPDWYLGFDVLDAERDAFWSANRRDALLTAAGLVSVRRMAAGRLSARDVLDLLTEKSAYADAPVEGIYLRLDDDGWLRQRAKIIRPEFVQSIGEHWTRGDLAANRCVAGV